MRPSHLGPLAALFELARSGTRVGACGSVPPRHGKTELILHAIAWWLRSRPQDTIAYVTYAADVAESKSMLARDYARAAGVTIRPDKSALHEWRTPEGGGLLATGIGGPLVGHGVKLAIVDDPFKNRVEAESALIRDRTQDWFTSALTTRVEPGGSRFVIHTRWHPDDLIGRLLESNDEHWLRVNLPAVDDAGGALWPEVWPLEELDAKRAAVGEYDWWSLFQGEPRPRGGKVFQRDPVRYERPDYEGARVVIAVDCAGTEDSRADHTAAVALLVKGHGAQQTADVLEVLRVQMEPQNAAPLLLAFQERHGFAPLVIESTRDGKAVGKALKRIEERIRVIDVAPIGDKFTRAQPCASAWNAGRVRVPANAPWLRDFLAEVDKFTGVGGGVDDQVDALAHAWNAASGMAEPAPPPPPPPPQGRFNGYAGRGFGS